MGSPFFFLFCWVFWFFPNAPSFFFGGESSWNGETERQHTIIEICRSPFSFIFIYLFSLDFWVLAFPFFFSTISFQFVLLFFTFYFLFFILSRLFWLPCLSPLFLLRLSRHGRWLINHVAASIEKPSPVVSDAVPLFRLPFPAFCRLARSSCFPESTGTRERKKKKNDKTKRKQENSLPPTKKNWFEMCIFFSLKKKSYLRKKAVQIQKRWGGGGTNRKKNETNGCAPCWLLSLEQVVMLFPFLSVNISADILRLDEFSSFSRSIYLSPTFFFSFSFFSLAFNRFFVVYVFVFLIYSDSSLFISRVVSIDLFYFVFELFRALFVLLWFYLPHSLPQPLSLSFLIESIKSVNWRIYTFSFSLPRSCLFDL